MTLPGLLRALLWVGLAGLGVLLVRGAPPGARGELVLEQAEPSTLVDALLSPTPPSRIRWAGPALPDGRALWLLSPSAPTPALTLPLGTSDKLSVTPPVRPSVGRNAALGVSVQATPGASVWVRWSDALGATDSLVVGASDAGVAEAGLRVRPVRAGWQRWQVWSDTDTAAVGAWAREVAPPGVLVLGGTPGWESRFVLRALEEAGLGVEGRFDLGRTAIGGGLPPDLDDFAVVLLTGEVSLSRSAQERLDTFVREGGGVLLAPALSTIRRATDTSLGVLLERWGMPDSVVSGVLLAGEAPVWALPAELTPLPPPPARVRTVGLSGVAAPGVSLPVLDGQGRALAALAAVGRGRVAYVGLSETWRWRMEGGHRDAHGAWWRDWVAWAAGGLKQPFIVSVPDRPVEPGSAVRVVVEALEVGAEPSRLTLERPDGSVTDIPVRAGAAYFLADLPGPYRVHWPGGETGVWAEAGANPPGPADRSLVAIASGGGPAMAEPASALRWSPTNATPLPVWLGVLLGLLLAAEWLFRRVRGGP